jgi:acylphosphatase
MEDVLRVRAVVRGQVQMVGFRAFVLHHANRLSHGGSVRNRPDGSVECVVEGPRGAVSALLEYLRRGPSHARVEAVDVAEEPPAGERPPMQVTA